MSGLILGRQSVLDDVARRLRESRLVTITGPGGIGKTTVADATARAEAHRYPLGTTRVDLTVVDDEREVSAAMAAQLGFGSFRALLDSPTDQPALIVVDNCEHVLEAAATAIDQLVDACASPTILATSRSPLGVPGESVAVLGPLDLPSIGGDEQGSAAVQLFLARAREAGAVIDDADLPAVARLCGLLDGVPLAIELAAARTRVLTPVELLDRLGDLDTFRRSRTRGAARHRSLRDTIAWSYALLDADDQRNFDRWSVLTGPFTLEDAHAIGDDRDESATLDRLQRLVDDSLLATSSVAGVTHYRQLEVVRAYARERLVGSGQWDAAWQRVVDRVTARAIDLATDVSAGWDRSSLATSVSRLDQHLAALRWCVDHDDAPARSMLLVATLWGVVHQGHVGDIAPLAERTLERWDDPTTPGWADAAATTATCRYLDGRPHDAIALAERALPSATTSPYAPCTLRRVIAHASVALGDLGAAIDHLTDAIRIAEGSVPELAAEMSVSRAELLAASADSAPDADAVIVEQLSGVREIATAAERTGVHVIEVWARTVEASLLARTDEARARAVAERTAAAASAAAYSGAESVNLHTLATLDLLSGDVGAAAAATRRLIDGLVARGAEGELRNALRLAAVVLERVGDPDWEPLAVTAQSLPVVSLFSLPGRERCPLPPTGGVPLELRAAVADARRGLDTLQNVDSPHVRDAATTPPPGESTAAPGTANEWCREGDLWRLTYAGLTVRVPSSKGLFAIARLLAAPNVDVHCLDLAGAAVDDRSSGEVIDAEARRQYEQRIRELQADVDEAEADADLVRGERARAELDALVDHLTAAVGLGGRTRRQRDTAERARSAVTHLVRSTIRRLRGSHAALADHLDGSIQTGIYCRYQPDTTVEWSRVTPAG